jgi:hypothetical protein
MEAYIMGGYGSGRRRWNGEPKSVVENHVNISLAWFKQNGFLKHDSNVTSTLSRGKTPIASFCWKVEGTKEQLDCIRAIYQYKNPYSQKWIEVDQAIELQTTSIYTSRQRYWFSCPDCEARCLNIHLRLDETIWHGFGCRKCRNLVHRSTRNTEYKTKWGWFYRTLRKGGTVPIEVAHQYHQEKFGTTFY